MSETAKFLTPEQAARVDHSRFDAEKIDRAKVYGLVVQVTHPLSPYIVYNSPKKQKNPA